MTQCLPRFRPGDAIGEQPVIALKRYDGVVCSTAEIAIGMHRAIHVAIANMAQLLLKFLHRVALVTVFECRGCFGGMFMLLGFFHVQTFTATE